MGTIRFVPDYFILAFSFVFPIAGFAHQAWHYDNYQVVDHTNFRDFPVFHQQLDADNPDIPLLNATIFFLANEQRVQHNMPPLGYHERLEAAAYHHARAMATQGFFSHTNPGDRRRESTSDRAKRAGIANPYIAENIAMNYVRREDTYLSMAEKFITQWMNSPPHRASILSDNGRQMGAGTYSTPGDPRKIYATQKFQWFHPLEESRSISDHLPAMLPDARRLY